MAGIAAFIWTVIPPVDAESGAAQSRRLIDGLRRISVPKEDKKVDELNQRMDAVWGYVHGHRSAALPIVSKELEKAVADPVPDNFFLMDMGYLLLVEEDRSAGLLGISALERIDPTSEIIQANWEELFHFAMKLGAGGAAPERYLPRSTGFI